MNNELEYAHIYIHILAIILFFNYLLFIIILIIFFPFLAVSVFQLWTLKHGFYILEQVSPFSRLKTFLK